MSRRQNLNAMTTPAERKRKSRAKRIAEGYCSTCTSRKAAPGKSTCTVCLGKKLKEPVPPPALNRKITIDEAREVIDLINESSHDDQAMALRYAVNKILG